MVLKINCLSKTEPKKVASLAEGIAKTRPQIGMGVLAKPYPKPKARGSWVRGGCKESSRERFITSGFLVRNCGVQATGFRVLGIESLGCP